jgi:hypothetical protein
MHRDGLGQGGDLGNDWRELALLAELQQGL